MTKIKKQTNPTGTEYSFNGKIIEIRYYSEDTSWGKLKVSVDKEIPFGRNQFEWDEETGKVQEIYVVNVLGKMPKPEIGHRYNFETVHTFNPKYQEDQFTIINMTSSIPKTLNDQVAFLRSIITENQARSLLAVYPNIVEMVVNGDEVDLTNVDGIKEATFEKIQNKILENFAIGDILSLLVPIGISLNKIRKLLEGEKNVELLKQKLINNPYILTKIPGISFRTADKIAVQLNPSLKISEERLTAFVQDFLYNIAESNGDTWVNINSVKTGIIENVPDCEKFFNDKFINSGSFYCVGDKFGLKRYYDMEKYVWDKLIELDNSEPLTFNEEDIIRGIEITEEQQGFALTDEQLNVVQGVLANSFSIVGGKAGSGKTTITKTILNILNCSNYSFRVAAFSAKAAQRSKQVTGFAASTIHKMLSARGLYEFEFNENYKLDVDFIVLEESSMTNTFLFYSVLKAIDISKTKILMVGDRCQIAPISAGNTFYDLIESDAFKVFHLTKIQRQAQNSAIIVDANKIRDGVDPLNGNRSNKTIHGGEMFYLFREDKENIFSIAVQSYIKSVSEKGVENTFLITPRKQGTLNCVDEFNKEIQRILNDENKDNKVVFGKKEFRLKDRVLHTLNSNELKTMNGEVGFVVAVDEKNKSVTVKYDDGKIVNYVKDDLKMLDLGWALSVHRCQGSEAKDVILVLDNAGYILLSNSLFYTGVTRAKERCLVIAQKYAFDRALEENKNVRNTWTKDFEYAKPLH